MDDIADSPAPADASSFDELVRPHWRAMSIVAERMAGPLAEDVLQDALLNAWRKRHQYDPSRGRAVTWLLAIVADQAFKSARWHRRRPVTVPAPDDLAHPPTTANTDPAERLDVERALRALTDRQRTAVLLHYASACLWPTSQSFSAARRERSSRPCELPVVDYDRC